MGATITELADRLAVDPADIETLLAGYQPDDEPWEETGVLAAHMVDELHDTLDPRGERTVPELYPDRPAGTVVLPKSAAWASEPGVVHVASARAGLPAMVTRCREAITARVPSEDVPDDATACLVCFHPDRQ